MRELVYKFLDWHVGEGVNVTLDKNSPSFSGSILMEIFNEYRIFSDNSVLIFLLWNSKNYDDNSGKVVIAPTLNLREKLKGFFSLSDIESKKIILQWFCDKYNIPYDAVSIMKFVQLTKEGKNYLMTTSEVKT